MSYLKEVIGRRKQQSAEHLSGGRVPLQLMEALPSQHGEVQSAVPFSQAIAAELREKAVREYIREGRGDARVTEADLQKLQQRAGVYLLPFLRWESLRRVAGTGFEGYGAGTFSSSEDMAEALAQLGLDVLSRVESEFRSPESRRLFWATLRGEEHDPRAAHFLEGIFGMLLARLRQDTAGVEAVHTVRNQLTQLASSLPQLEYWWCEGGICEQKYQLPASEKVMERVSKNMPINGIPLTLFRGSELELGYAVMAALGKFGHPLYRAAHLGAKNSR